MFHLSDTFTSVPNEARLVVRIGSALLPGEVHVRLSLLRMGKTEVIHLLYTTRSVSILHTTIPSSANH